MTKSKNILKFEIISTIFIILLGTLLHFTFVWSNNYSLIGIFSAVNESVWEHLKILFFPMLITTIIGYLYFKNEIPNYLCIKTKGIFIALSFIVIFFYTYSGILGTHYPVIDIISFIVAAIIFCIYSYKKVKAEDICNNLLALMALITFSILFIIFTFNPPHIGIFKDLSTNSYGFKK